MLLQRSCGGRGGGAAGLAASQIVLFNEMSAHGVPVVSPVPGAGGGAGFRVDDVAEDEGGGQAVTGGAVVVLRAPGGGEVDGAAANLLVEILETGPALPGDHNLYHND